MPHRFGVEVLVQGPPDDVARHWPAWFASVEPPDGVLLRARAEDAVPSRSMDP